MNGGVTYVCEEGVYEGRELLLYREEEMGKVLMHEMMHVVGLGKEESVVEYWGMRLSLMMWMIRTHKQENKYTHFMQLEKKHSCNTIPLLSHKHIQHGCQAHHYYIRKTQLLGTCSLTSHSSNSLTSHSHTSHPSNSLRMTHHEHSF